VVPLLLLVTSLLSMAYAPGTLAASIAVNPDGAETSRGVLVEYTTSGYLNLQDAPSGRTGTGIVVDDRSHVLTSYHVVEKCDSLMLRHSNLVIRARLIRFDDKRDLAILVPERPFPAIPAIFREGPPAAGESVVIAGFPKEVVSQGLLKAVSAEIVSIKAETPHDGMMRLSAGLNQGASGGPVLDRSGRVIGLLAGMLVDSRSGKPVDAPGLAIRPEIVQKFLKRAGMDFRKGKERPATVSAIAKQGANQVVKIECSGR
jgi:serine protease Do